eukprot:1183253-Prorocentrum_minimum.AAC.5
MHQQFEKIQQQNLREDEAARRLVDQDIKSCVLPLYVQLKTLISNYTFGKPRGYAHMVAGPKARAAAGWERLTTHPPLTGLGKFLSELSGCLLHSAVADFYAAAQYKQNMRIDLIRGLDLQVRIHPSGSRCPEPSALKRDKTLSQTSALPRSAPRTLRRINITPGL